MKVKMMLSIAVLTACCLTARARSLLYYYDFDTASSDGSLYFTDQQNRGTGTAAIQYTKGANMGYTTDGALGSGGAFIQSSQNTLVLGNATDSLGCNTTSGFTISMWFKYKSNYNKWSDFFGFRLGGVDYRCEFGEAGANQWTVFHNNGGGAAAIPDFISCTDDVWHHLSFVFLNGTNSMGRCSIYLDGVARCVMEVVAAGNLQQVLLGSVVRAGGYRVTDASNTQIDEFAIYDYPASDAQIKWLSKFRPEPSVASPARAMPYCYQFFRAVSGSGMAEDNSGTGALPTTRFKTGYANGYGGALGTQYGLNQKVGSSGVTYCVEDSGSDGLGATSASGFTFTFWLWAPSGGYGEMNTSAWRDFLGFTLGGRHFRLETSSVNPVNFQILNQTNTPDIGVPAKNTWYHYALAWNHATKSIDVYRNGTKITTADLGVDPSDSATLQRWLIGPKVYAGDGTVRDVGSTGFWIDELSLFNYTLSLDQISWLAGGNLPNLPPMAETNLTRSVQTDGSWSANSAKWTDANNNRWVRWPTLEDVDVEASASFANGVTLVNDTCVTAKKIVFTAVGGTAAAALTAANGSKFSPENVEVGSGLTLTVPFGHVVARGALTFGVDSKIIIDVSGYTGEPTALTCESMAFPAGTTDPSAFFAASDPRYSVSVNAAHTKVTLALDTVAATAEWTRGAGSDDMSNPANWCCRNTSGAILENTLPCEYTTIVIPANATCSFVGANPPDYLAVRMATGASLSADCDWRGLGVVRFEAGSQLDLKGHKLQLCGSTGESTLTDSVGGGAVQVEVAVGQTWTNEDLTLTGLLKLIKAGAGTLALKKRPQTYSGGNEIFAGTAKIDSTVYFSAADAVAGKPFGENTADHHAAVRVDAGAVFDIGSYTSGWGCHEITLNGGKLMGVTSQANFALLTLTADSEVEGTEHFGSGSALNPVLNGHTLSVSVRGGRDFHLGSVTGPGVIHGVNGGYLRFNSANTPSVDSQRISLSQGSNMALKIFADLDVNDYTAAYVSEYGAGTATMRVYGAFKPVNDLAFYGCVLQDGSTLDLSGKSDVWSTTRTGARDGFSANSTVTFADNARIRIDIGSRVLTNNTKLVSWTTTPANLDTLRFRFVDAAKGALTKRSDGVYYQRGFLLVLH